MKEHTDLILSLIKKAIEADLASCSIKKGSVDDDVTLTEDQLSRFAHRFAHRIAYRQSQGTFGFEPRCRSGNLPDMFEAEHSDATSLVILSRKRANHEKKDKKFTAEEIVESWA